MKWFGVLALMMTSFYASSQSVLSLGTGISFNAPADYLRSKVPRKSPKSSLNHSFQAMYHERVSNRFYLGAALSITQFKGRSKVEKFQNLGNPIGGYTSYTVTYTDQDYKTNILSLQFNPLFRAAGSEHSLFAFYTGMGIGVSCSYVLYDLSTKKHLDFKISGLNIGIPFALSFSPFAKKNVGIYLSATPQMTKLSAYDWLYMPINAGANIWFNKK